MARVEVEVKFSTFEHGPKVAKIIDRITVDDIVRHMMDKEIYRIMTGIYEGDDVSREFKDFLLRDRYSVRG